MYLNITLYLASFIAKSIYQEKRKMTCILEWSMMWINNNMYLL
jgi:hypothetical protein